MQQLEVLMVGLPAELSRICQISLSDHFPGMRFQSIAARERWTVDAPVDGFRLALVNCSGEYRHGLAFISSNVIGAGIPVVALVDGFEPERVNHLLAAGADRVIPLDLAEHLLPGCIQSLLDSAWAGQHQTAEESEPYASAAVDMKAQLQKLIGAQNFFESVLFNLPVMLVVLGLDGQIIVFNGKCEEVTGYTAAEMRGRLVSDVVLLPEEVNGVEEVFEDLRQGRFPIAHENAWLTKDGRPRQILWANTALLDSAGKVIFIVGMGQDITEEVNRRNELRELENRFERIFHASPVGIGLVRFKDRIVIDANENLLGLLGRNREEVVGQLADQIGLFPEQGLRELLDMVARQGPIDNHEWRMMGKGRKPVHILVSMEIVEWDQQIVVLVIVRDISDRVQAEEKIRRLNDELERRVLERTRALEAIKREMQAEVEYRKAIEHSSQRINQIIWELPDVIAMCDVGGYFQFINKAGRRLYGLSEIEPVTHMSVYQTYPVEELERVRAEIVPQVWRNGIWRGETELQLLDGVRIPIMQTILAHYDKNGEIDFFSTIIRDITEEKQAAEQIKLAYQAEKELGQLRSSFFAMTSHQFRTPLSAILSSAELLEHYSGQWEPEKRLLHLRRIQDQVQLLNEMLNDILDIGRLEMKTDEIGLETVDICKVIKNILESYSMVDNGNHPLIFSCVEGSLWVRSVPRLIDRVVENLLSNAVKYSAPGARVDVRVWAKDEWAVIEVEDNGIGIPAEELPMVFQPFYRAQNAGDVSGSGLGLMIVKRTLDLIGGEVRIESMLNAGTRVEVRIPLQRDET